MTPKTPPAKAGVNLYMNWGSLGWAKSAQKPNKNRTWMVNRHMFT